MLQKQSLLSGFEALPVLICVGGETEAPGASCAGTQPLAWRFCYLMLLFLLLFPPPNRWEEASSDETLKVWCTL